MHVYLFDRKSSSYMLLLGKSLKNIVMKLVKISKISKNKQHYMFIWAWTVIQVLRVL